MIRTFYRRTMGEVVQLWGQHVDWSIKPGSGMKSDRKSVMKDIDVDPSLEVKGGTGR
jgi:hypothetical protein